MINGLKAKSNLIYMYEQWLDQNEFRNFQMVCLDSENRYNSDEIISPSKEDSWVGWAAMMGGASLRRRAWPGRRLSYRTARAWLLYKQQAHTPRHSFNLKLAHNNGIQGNIHEIC